MERLGVPFKLRQQRLGHIRLSLGVNTHVVSEEDERLAASDICSITSAPCSGHTGANHVDAEYLVQAYMGVGNYDQALTWLEWAASHQPNVLTSIKVEPIYDPLRSDPRFQNLLYRVGLAQ